MRLGLLFEGGIALAACVFGAFLTTPPWQRVFWRPTDFAWGLLATLPLVLGLLVMRRFNGGPIGRLNRAVDELLVPLFAHCSLIQLALVYSLRRHWRGTILSRPTSTFADWLARSRCRSVPGQSRLRPASRGHPTYAVVATLVGAYLAGSR